MKKLILAILLVTSAVQAYAHDGGSIRPGRPDRPGQPAPYPGNPYEPNPYDPNPYQPGYPSHPGYGDYGPARTYRWEDQGESKIDKFITATVSINGRDRLVNEILLRANNADVQITRAYARLSNGRTVEIATGTIRQGRDARVRLDYRYSVRVDEIVIEATSPSLIGSRARLQVWLGLAE
ncbi:hypothetical protein CIK05_13180 [Bdellovibrio sp. qaytius]|nr:hypothetical protein CIK05_13180 [Bdellovibrio sp. qaytius]